MNNRSQAVRLPKEFQFQTPEVFIRKVAMMLSCRPGQRIGLPTSQTLTVASDAFMKDVEDLTVQERKP